MPTPNPRPFFVAPFSSSNQCGPPATARKGISKQAPCLLFQEKTGFTAAAASCRLYYTH